MCKREKEQSAKLKVIYLALASDFPKDSSTGWFGVVVCGRTYLSNNPGTEARPIW